MTGGMRRRVDCHRSVSLHLVSGPILRRVLSMCNRSTNTMNTVDQLVNRRTTGQVNADGKGSRS